jgi:hypothetical protein
MNIEFHYYIIYILAKYSGLDEMDCITVAYSSQYMDNNLVGQVIHAEAREYRTIVTQNYGWWSDWFPKHVYIPFHFFPGDINYNGAKRKDGKTNRFNCTPGSAFVTELLARAFDSRDFHRIGIALHTFADSWAHQNFTGTNDEWNSLGEESPIPKVGHAEALGQPDKMTGKWIDARISGEYQYIDNEARFLEAGRRIYERLIRFTGRNNHDWERVRDRIKSLVGAYDESDSRRSERISNYILAEELLEYNKYDWLREAVHAGGNESILEDTFKGYDKFSWFKDQLLYKTGMLNKPPLLARDNFFFSHYFQWHEAAKAHLKEAQAILKGIL